MGSGCYLQLVSDGELRIYGLDGRCLARLESGPVQAIAFAHLVRLSGRRAGVVSLAVERDCFAVMVELARWAADAVACLRPEAQAFLKGGLLAVNGAPATAPEVSREVEDAPFAQGEVRFGPSGELEVYVSAHQALRLASPWSNEVAFGALLAACARQAGVSPDALGLHVALEVFLVWMGRAFGDAQALVQGGLGPDVG